MSEGLHLSAHLTEITYLVGKNIFDYIKQNSITSLNLRYYTHFSHYILEKLVLTRVMCKYPFLKLKL